MKELKTFEEFLKSQQIQISIEGFVFNLFLTAMMGWILSKFYTRYGNSISNRKTFSNNFMLLTIATMIIITIVKSSLALSLGLVGALSIVRFRTAIKEPEELTYLFIAITIGLGLGADLRLITTIAFLFILSVIFSKSFFEKKEKNINLLLSISTSNGQEHDINHFSKVLEKYCDRVDLRRYDSKSPFMEAAYLIEFRDILNLTKIQSELQTLDPELGISFIDNQNIL
jgi:hypothetical protein